MTRRVEIHLDIPDGDADEWLTDPPILISGPTRRGIRVLLYVYDFLFGAFAVAGIVDGIYWVVTLAAFGFALGIWVDWLLNSGYTPPVAQTPRVVDDISDR